MSYCTICELATTHEVHKVYHDTQYGFPIKDDNELFERLVLEINQAGLSWETILKKQVNFKKAYDYFDIQKVANYKQTDIDRLLNDSGIIRNKLKINAAIHNAQAIINLITEFGSIYNWLNTLHPLSLEQWVKEFKKKFKFVGKEIVNEFLMSIGYLEGAHDKSCKVYIEILNLNPKWTLK